MKEGKEAYKLVVRDLRSSLIEHEPPGVTEHGRRTNVGTDNHVAEEEPARDEGLLGGTGRATHDAVVGRVEAESCDDGGMSV